MSPRLRKALLYGSLTTVVGYYGTVWLAPTPEQLLARMPPPVAARERARMADNRKNNELLMQRMHDLKDSTEPIHELGASQKQRYEARARPGTDSASPANPSSS